MPLDKDFYQHVYQVVRAIPYGRVTTYGMIAKAIGSPQASRMVGWAMNASHGMQPPIPAHRVVNRLGMLSGKAHFSTPNEMQLRLEKEGIQIVDDRIMNFNDLVWNHIIHMQESKKGFKS